MKHKFISFLLLLSALAGLLCGTASAEKDAVDRFAEEMFAFQDEIAVPVRDFDALMKEAFDRYPELSVYYAGCSYLSTADGLELTMRYANTGVAREDILVVTSEDQCMAAIGLASCDQEMELHLVFADGYDLPAEGWQPIYDRLSREFYLIKMGLKSWNSTGWTFDAYDTVYYQLELFNWEDATAETVKFWRDETEKAILELVPQLFALDMPDYQKVFLAHDYLVDTCVYDMDDINVQMEWVNHMAYGALCEGSCVCQGYSEAFRMLMDAAGIPCYYVSGDGHGESHSWNCLQLDGEWYLIDVTWDDPVTSDGSNVKLYDYFLITDDQMARDHTWERGDYPPANGTYYTYDRVMELMGADSTEYTEYTNETVRTQAIMREELLKLLYGEEEPTIAPEEPVEEPEEPVEEPEEPVEEPEEPVEEPEEPVEEPEEPVEEPEEPVEEPEEPTEPDEQDEDEDELKPVVLLEKDKEKEKSEPMGVSGLIVLLIVLALCIVVAVLVVNCIANNRIRVERQDRKERRDRRVANSVRRRRRF